MFDEDLSFYSHRPFQVNKQSSSKLGGWCLKYFHLQNFYFLQRTSFSHEFNKASCLKVLIKPTSFLVYKMSTSLFYLFLYTYQFLPWKRRGHYIWDFNSFKIEDLVDSGYIGLASLKREGKTPVVGYNRGIDSVIIR